MGNLPLVNSNFNTSSIISKSQSTLIVSQLSQQKDPNLLNFLRILFYSTINTQLNNDSDKKILQNTLLKFVSYDALKLNYTQVDQSFVATQGQNMTSYSFPNIARMLPSLTSTSQQFNLNGPNSKVLLGEQSIRNSLLKTPQTPDLNLSPTMNAFLSNKSFFSSKNRPFNIFSGLLLYENSYVDYPYFNNCATSKSFNSIAQSAVHSLKHGSLNSLEHDTTISKLRDIGYKKNQGLTATKQNIYTNVGDLFVGSREKTPKSLNTSY
jgi:hypothetical protein